jgi:SagB-type dehydrogenase family enzyme
VIEPCDGDGNLAEDVRPELMQWEFHDLLFHNRSRQGRHDAPLGAQFRFHDKLSPQPVVKPNRWASRALPLYRPTAMSIAAADPPFSVVLESRRSIRAHSDVRPITLDQVGDFLFRAARNRFRYMTSLGEFVSRPYPCGGASYEAEVYLTANRCLGLERGFYYYDPEAHTLSLVETANADTEGLLDDAFVSCAGICRPQVLLTIASRFHRVAWKYSGMAYATQLKNVGALYQTFYLVATAMNLAGCGLGLGNVHRFARLTGISFLEEGSIGEFMLGNPA